MIVPALELLLRVSIIMLRIHDPPETEWTMECIGGWLAFFFSLAGGMHKRTPVQCVHASASFLA